MKLRYVEVEPCGASHISRALLTLGDAEESAREKDPAAEYDPSPAAVINTRRIAAEELSGLNKYELLGVDKHGVGVDDKVLKQAYHKALLTYHPDKNSAAEEEEEDEVFLAIQDAYTMLSDPSKRRAYDSTNEFDDTIPKGNEAEKQGDAFDFFATYGPVFRSNSRWSNKPRVPDLGDDGTPLEHVHKFYEFWTRFDSWRDYSLDEPEHDVEQAECREEKRWMAKENDKIAKKKKMDEYARIALLIDRARANDPRLKRAREEEARAKQELKDARRRATLEKEEAAAAAKAAAEAVAEEERKRKEEGRLADKLELEKQKKAARKAKKKLRDAHGEKARSCLYPLSPPSASPALRPLARGRDARSALTRPPVRALRPLRPASRRTRPRSTC